MARVRACVYVCVSIQFAPVLTISVLIFFKNRMENFQRLYAGVGRWNLFHGMHVMTYSVGGKAQ